MLRYGPKPLPEGVPNTSSLLVNNGIGGGWQSVPLVDYVLTASYVPSIVTTDGIQGNGTIENPVQLQPSISITAVTVSSGFVGGTVSGTVFNASKLTASSGINLVNTQIEAVDYIDFYTGSSPTWRNGRIFWDNAQGALAVYNAEADITLQVGQENYVRARNQTGSPILNGTAVRLSGALGDRPTITKAQSIDQTALLLNTNDIIGLATHDIEHGTDGYVTTQGLVNGLNTNAYEAGDLLWVSQTAGQLTNQVPNAPYDKIFIGVVTRKNTNNGSIFVFPRQSMHFHDLSSVSSSIYTQGDLFVYQTSGSSGVWINTKQLSGSYSFTGSLNITGALSGSPNIAVASNIVPVSSGTISLGSLDKPFKEIFVGSGSISIASSTSGDPATVISNNGGNLEISAGGIKLLGTGSFIAATGSFQYVSGNVVWNGNSNQLGYISASNGFTGSFTGSFYGDDNFTKYYGVFSDETLQTASAINTEAAIRFGNTHEANGISIVSGSQIKVAKAGLYDIAYTTQYHKTTNPSVTVSNWLKRTGSNVDKTNVDFVMPNNTNYHTFVNFYTLYLNANEYVEIMYSDGSTLQLSGTAAQISPVRPSTPSARLKITKL